MKKQTAICVKLDVTGTGLLLDELNQMLAEGWRYAESQTTTPGQVLVILEKDE